ncbi:MAG: 7,8-didemethyl-8-hydroxy-5-deazariboflavin synthase subunit CofH [Alphaproteobacteria bacterium]|nr:MAG: 7,8-didemethyl-8-hydroxy-5-deazariboflavin synthase subunit CofH [Alphaproteobacteria bacterium]
MARHQKNRIWALVPIKPFEAAKGRLREALPVTERRALAEAMARDVLAALRGASRVEGILLVSRGIEAKSLAEKFGAELWEEVEGADLNGALREGLEVLKTKGVDRALILPGDLPFITAQAVDALIDKAPKAALVASHDGDGTNALLLDLNAPFVPEFGPGSFFRHRAVLGEEAVAESKALAFDLDTATDLEASIARFSRLPEKGRTRAFIGDHLRLSEAAAHKLAERESLDALMTRAAEKRDRSFGDTLTYSRKVFIPLTQLCRDVCHYCTFAKTPRSLANPFLTVDECIAIAKEGAALGCEEALFTLGEKPELRYQAAREALQAMGFASTTDYLAHVARRVFEETGLLPHVNPGCMDESEIEKLRQVAPSMGLMLESASDRLCEKGMPHYGSPDKVPALRLATLERAGAAKVPFTSGILIGIGETRAERVDALLKLRDLHEAHGHLQEVIVQNFKPKPDTKMAGVPEPDLKELLWSIAMARLILPGDVSVQAPPNLSPGDLKQLVAAGINDWGGVSPLTPDHVNPEAPWPHLDDLARLSAEAGKALAGRLTVYPKYVKSSVVWTDPNFHKALLQKSDGEGLARHEGWTPGGEALPSLELPAISTTHRLTRSLERLSSGDELSEGEVAELFTARGSALADVVSAADALRQAQVGDTVTYVVNRNINYTNICSFGCTFCAFSKGKTNETLRGTPYDIGLAETTRRAEEAWARGATEVCLQGGIHPAYTGTTYLEICRAIKSALPQMHIHAFSALEVSQGAETLGLSVPAFLEQLKDAGLDTMPGTAAEVLDDRVRTRICPDKLTSDNWMSVIGAAHAAGINTTATIMFGHIDSYAHWARHLVLLRNLQEDSLAEGRGCFTEFVPLPFVHMEAPMYLKSGARKGPTFRETVLMHGIARLVLGKTFTNIQASWTKLGRGGVAQVLRAGVNDLGGTLMNESISRAAGSTHGQEMPPEAMEELIRACDRSPRQRTTLYGPVSDTRKKAGRNAPPLQEVQLERVDRKPLAGIAAAE